MSNRKEVWVCFTQMLIYCSLLFLVSRNGGGCNESTQNNPTRHDGPRRLLKRHWLVTGHGCPFANLFGHTRHDFCFALLRACVRLFASLLRHPRFERWPLILRAFVVSFPTSIVSASIAAYIFGGVTSAGSSYIVQFLYGAMHLPLVASTFIVQVGTDYLDKLIILVIVTTLIARIPQKIREKI